MLIDLYQEYLYVIGKLKDIYKFDVEVDHKDIHTFFLNKKPIFKLFYGVFNKDPDAPTIVVSFHIDLFHPEAISWFVTLYKLHPMIQMHDSFIEDAAGETYLGEDALVLKDTILAQEILAQWLAESDRDEMETFVEADVMGRLKEIDKSFISGSPDAIIEFERMQKPHSDDEVQ